MKLEIPVTLLDNELVLVAEEDHRPAEVFRLGSVKMVFPDLSVRTIRVFGILGDVEQYEQRVEFEKMLRAECEKPEVLKDLFDYTGPAPHAKRFNSCQALTDKGWRSRNADHQRNHHAQAAH